MMTDGFNSCRNVVCNFTEGKIRILNFSSLQQLNYYNYIFLITELSCIVLLQELCTLSPKYACHQERLRQRKEPAKYQMFSTASSFWKQLEFPLFRDLVLVRRKGKCFAYSSDNLSVMYEVSLILKLPTKHEARLTTNMKPEK